MLAAICLCSEKVFTDVSMIATFGFIGCLKSQGLATRSTLSHTDVALIRVNIKANHVDFMTNSSIANFASFRCHWN